MIVHITRFLFVAFGALSGFAATRLLDWTEQTGFSEYSVIIIFLILGWSIGYVVGGIVGRELSRGFAVIEERLGELATTDLVLGGAGLLLGLIAAAIVSWPLRLVNPAWMAVVATGAMFILFAYVMMRIALLKRVEVAAAFPRLSGAGVTASSPVGAVLLDTSALIDGRFVELGSLGFLERTLRVPRFVLAELQTLADSADDIKRARGRRGLDLLTRLHDSEQRPELFEADFPEVPDTDDKLMDLAEEIGAAIMTVDFNLTKVARVRGIEVLNLNEVASALRPAYLPGEALRVRVVRPGKEADQGVGYLEDGTMVVVHGAVERVGEEVESEVTSVLQTSGGRMIFARASGAADVVAGSAPNDA